MMYAFIRWWASVFLNLYFRKIVVYDRDKIPATGPLIVASNHPSAFMEASVLSTVMKRPIHFLVRGDMFNPKFHWVFKWTKQIPIFRQKDGISNLRKNAATFDLTYRKLAAGEAVLIFPEAKTILEKNLRPIQRGTAHLAFGTIPFLKDNGILMIQPVGVNFTNPRLPGTDVVVKFGNPFPTGSGQREDREAIENFSSTLSDSMNPLVIQVDPDIEKNYDVLASIYFRMVHDNHRDADALRNLHKIANAVNNKSAINILIDQTDVIMRSLEKVKATDTIYFPDLLVFNRIALGMMSILKVIWLIAGGWLWRVVRGIIYSKIRTVTFQGPTSLGIFMVVMPFVALLLTIAFLIVGIPVYFVLVWLLVMLSGTLFRAPLDIIVKVLVMKATMKGKLKNLVLDLREEIEQMIHG